MSTELATTGKPFEVEESRDIAEYYSIPQSMVNMFWIKMGGNAYAKAPFLMMQAQKKGVQRIELILSQEDGKTDHWKCEVRIYPKLKPSELQFLISLSDKDQKKEYFDFFTAPTINYGYASPENVKMTTMHKFLREMAVTRGVARTCRIFSGLGVTAYEELEQAQLSPDQINDAKERIDNSKVIDVKAEPTPAAENPPGKNTVLWEGNGKLA